MSAVRKVVQLHPATVTEASRGQHLHPRRRGTVRTTFAMVTIKVQADVWATAMRLADGDARRLQVVSETEVVVHNNPRGH